MEVDVQDREQVDSGEKVEAREREREEGRRQNENKQLTFKHVTSWMACGWSECARCDTLSHNVVCAQGGRGVSVNIFSHPGPRNDQLLAGISEHILSF